MSESAQREVEWVPPVSMGTLESAVISALRRVADAARHHGYAQKQWGLWAAQTVTVAEYEQDREQWIAVKDGAAAREADLQVALDALAVALTDAGVLS